MSTALNIITLVPRESFGFVYWWYFEVPVYFILYILKFVTVYLDRLAVPLMLRSLFIPLFHDYTIMGRVLSFFFRVSRIIFGLVVNVMLTIVLSFFFLTWLTIPVFIITGLYLSSQ